MVPGAGYCQVHRSRTGDGLAAAISALVAHVLLLHRPDYLHHPRGTVLWTPLQLSKPRLVSLNKSRRINTVALAMTLFPSSLSIFFLCFCHSLPVRIGLAFVQIVRQRIHQHLWRDGRVWNSFPGGLVTLPDYTDSPSRLPWNRQQSIRAAEVAVPHGHRVKNDSQFTAVIYSQQQAGSPLVPAPSSGPLLHLLRIVSRSQHVARVGFQIERTSTNH